MSDSLRPHESQHARPPCPSPTPRVHPDSRPLSQWCHPASHPLSSPSPPAPSPSQHQSLFQWVNFAWGAQSTGVSALASFLKCLADIKKLNKIWGNSLHVNYPGYLQDIRYLCSRNAIQLFWHLKIQNTPYYRNALYRTVPLPLRPTEQKPQGRLEVNFEELIGVSQVYNKGSKMICWMNEKKPDFSCLFTFLKKLLV